MEEKIIIFDGSSFDSDDETPFAINCNNVKNALAWVEKNPNVKHKMVVSLFNEFIIITFTYYE